MHQISDKQAYVTYCRNPNFHACANVTALCLICRRGNQYHLLLCFRWSLCRPHITKNWQLAMDQLNLIFHFLRGRFEVTCLQYMLEVLIWRPFVHTRLILLLIVNNFLQTSPTQNWMELSHITQHMV